MKRRKGSNSLTQTTTGDAAQRAVVTRLQKTVFPNPLTRPCQQSHIHCQTCRGRLALSENKRTPGDDLLAQLSVWARRNGKRSRLSQAVFFFPCISHRGRRSIASEAVTYKDAKLFFFSPRLRLLLSLLELDRTDKADVRGHEAPLGKQ